MNSTKTIPVDIWTAQKTSYNFNGFCWPINILDLLEIRTAYEKILINILKNTKEETVKDALICGFQHLINETLSITEVLLVLTQFNENNLKPVATYQHPRWALSSKLITGKKLESSISSIEGFHPLPLKRVIKNKLKIIKGNLFSYPKESNLIGIFPSEFTLEYAKKKKIKLQFPKLSSLFPFTHIEEINCKDKPINLLVQEISNKVTNYIASRNSVKFSLVEIRESISIAVTGILSPINYYLNSKNIRNINGDVLGGSGANIYTRILGQSIKRRGNTLTCFEHGEAKAKRVYYMPDKFIIKE
ncbi:MAG: hypothetical protein IH950_08260 [Bacteroidetes bacterium]|nr:hypothetical protein [Bacteroidota bacterium]